jgi:hypothetical protein
MKAKEAISDRLFKLILAALIILFLIWLMSITLHEWIQPGY